MNPTKLAPPAFVWIAVTIWAAMMLDSTVAGLIAGVLLAVPTVAATWAVTTVAEGFRP